MEMIWFPLSTQNESRLVTGCPQTSFSKEVLLLARLSNNLTFAPYADIFVGGSLYANTISNLLENLG